MHNHFILTGQYSCLSDNHACRVCDNREGNVLHAVREMMFGTRENFAYLECARCSCLQILEVPIDLARHYPDNYYSYSSSNSKASFHARWYRGFLEFLKVQREHFASLGTGWIGKVVQCIMPEPYLTFTALKMVAAKTNSRILDVGCGSGQLLRKLEKIGFKNLEGIDPYIAEDFASEGVRIFKLTLDELKGNWDIIMFHHVFEHLPNPQETLRLVYERLTPSGTCIIRIPTTSSWAWKHYGVNWHQIDAPRHLFLHSIKSMQILADRTGFVMSEPKYDSNYYQFRGSELYQKNIAPTDKPNASEKISKFSAMDIFRMKQRARRFNKDGRGDQACFFLRKDKQKTCER